MPLIPKLTNHHGQAMTGFAPHFGKGQRAPAWFPQTGHMTTHARDPMHEYPLPAPFAKFHARIPLPRIYRLALAAVPVMRQQFPALFLAQSHLSRQLAAPFKGDQ